MAMHHPFTMPMEEDWDKIDSDPGAVRAKAYDIVLNGTELGGGSVRIHQDDIQRKCLRYLDYKRACMGSVRFPAFRIQVWCTATRRAGLRFRPYGNAYGTCRFHP